MSGYTGSTAVSVRFVPMGTVAPDPLPPGEVWVDVGSRAAPGVLDHHGGDTGAWSASQLVVEHFEELVAPIVRDARKVVLVTHEAPDLDAICGVWLVQRLLEGGVAANNRDALHTIVAAVSENDQGFVRTESPEHSWPVVMRTLVAVDARGLGDSGRLELGSAALARTINILGSGGSLVDAAAAVSTTSTRIVLAQARRDYLEDLGRATLFQVRLPVRLPHSEREIVPPGPVAPPPRQTVRWSLADGLYLEEPTSSLFKELVRGDTERSPLGEGFALLVVSRREQTPPAAQPRYRHVISTDPLTGLHLQGLGSMLEEAERRREDETGEIASGRERLAPGEGRHGSGVPSPWYDGRGHDFTIIDSPTVTVAGRDVCGSLLTPAGVLEIVWCYGDPAAHITALEAVTIMVVPMAGPVPPAAGWRVRDAVSEAASDLLPESAAALSGLTVHSPTLPRVLREGPLRLVDEQLWATDGGVAVWVGRFDLGGEHATFRELASAIKALRWGSKGSFLPPGLVAGDFGDVFHVASVRARAADIATGERLGASALAMYQLAFGDSSSFASHEMAEEAACAARAFSRDRRVTALACRFGAVVVSERTVPFASEADFHRPERLTVLSAVLGLQRAALHELWRQYISHRAGGGGRVEALVLGDREQLFRLEQELLLPALTSCGFGQRLADLLNDALGIPDLTRAARGQVESLATQVIELRSKFYQRLAFLVSVVLAPLAITAGFFSGTHMQRQFAKAHYTFFPSDWQPAGWIQFGIVLAALSAVVTLFWLIAYRTLRSSSLLKWLRRRPRAAKRRR